MKSGHFFKDSLGGMLLAVLSGALIGLSTSGYDWGWLAWSGIIPLFAAIHGKGLRFSFGLGMIAGFTEQGCYVLKSANGAIHRSPG